ncbi:unnamed protein product [Echinostoma caproni]|uniref:MFS domain-containing protein n=1 Tax=Echinostoma caproni TaxID=27848 RepID=A0A183B1Q3_9TREM|nr:unnamed protein product [Echinostoma caproni]
MTLLYNMNTRTPITSGGNPLLASVWGSLAAGPFSLMHAGYGLGAAVAPLLVAPFTIRPYIENETKTLNTTNSTVQLADAVDSDEVNNPLNALLSPNSTESALIQPVVPYSLVGLVLLICAAFFIPFDGIPWSRLCRSHAGSPLTRQPNVVSLYPLPPPENVIE